MADTYDAMTTSRPYRAGLDPAVAVAEIGAQVGRQFCPSVVAAFQAVSARGGFTLGHGEALLATLRPDDV